VPFRGRPLVTWALEAARATDLHPVLLIVGRRGTDVIAAAPPGVTAVHARGFRKGIAHSLRAALDALDGYVQVQAVCVGLADQPLVGPEAYRRLAAAHAAGADLAVATYDGQRANPVLLGRSLWGAARALEGDVGARALMGDHDVVEVDCSDTGSPADVDTLDDLRALEALDHDNAPREDDAPREEADDADH
jgi:molybdenum cofactor cytidylyltransferase/nicotine blue oxidoreductase